MIIIALSTSTSSALASPLSTDSAKIANPSSKDGPAVASPSFLSPREAGRRAPSATSARRTASRRPVSRLDEGASAAVRLSNVSSADSGSSRHEKASRKSRADEAGGRSSRRLTVSLETTESNTWDQERRKKMPVREP